MLGSLSQPTVFADDEYKADLVSKGVDYGDATLEIEDGELELKLRTTGLVAGNVYSVWGNSNSLNGFIAKKDGSAKFEAEFEIDKAPSHFIVKLKDHGPPIDGEVILQKTTPNHGCNGTCPTAQTATYNALKADDDKKKKKD